MGHESKTARLETGPDHNGYQGVEMATPIIQSGEDLTPLLEAVPPNLKKPVTRIAKAAYDLGRASRAEDQFWNGWNSAWTGAHREGLNEGYAQGYRAALDTEARAQREALRGIPLDGDSYANLADQRGEHDRAERQRQILTERGIA